MCNDKECGRAWFSFILFISHTVFWCCVHLNSHLYCQLGGTPSHDMKTYLTQNFSVSSAIVSNSSQLIFQCSDYFAGNKNCCSRITFCGNFRLSKSLFVLLLLILSGDVEINPGPPVPYSNVKFAHLNPRSVISIHEINKPLAIQEYILDTTLTF